MADESQIDPTNQKVGVLLSYGVPEEDIVARLSESDDPAHQNWVRQYNLLQVEKRGKEKAGITDSLPQTNEDAIKKQAELINQPSQVGPSLGKLAEIGVVGKIGYELGKQIPTAVEYGTKLFGTLKDKMAVPPVVETPPIVEAAPSGVAKLQERFNLVPKKESTPEETRQQKLKAAAATAQQQMIPGAVAPAPVAGNATTNIIPGTTAAAPAAPVAAVVPPVPVALPATPVAEVPVSPIATPTSAVMETPENPVAKAAALVEDKTPIQFNIESRDASETFGQGAERIRYSDQKSGGSIDVLKRPDGSASVMSLEVPEAFRGQGIGESLQSKVLQDFPEMQGQVSSKAAATTAYRLGRRPPNQPNATLDDVFKLMDENSSVNLVSPKMQQTFSSIPTAVVPPEITPGAAAILETQTPAATAVTAKQEKKIKGAVAPTGPIETVKTGSGLDAFLGQGAAKERIPSTFKTAAEIPAGYAFVPGMDVGGMNTARNRLGQEGYTEFVKAKGVPFGTYDETQKVLKSLDENRIGPTLTREQRKTIGAPMLPTTTGLGGKAIKVGGVAGALLAVSELASAQSLPEAGSKALEIGSGLLPVPLQGAMFSGGTNANETEQLAFLRRMQQAKARGAGNRGMAYDPRIPYNPQFMDVGIPPPFNR